MNPEKNFAEIESSSNSSSAIASIPDNEFQKPSIVTLKFLDDTWVQLRDENDEIILSQLMNEGDEYSYNILILLQDVYIYFIFLHLEHLMFIVCIPIQMSSIDF